MAAAVGDAGSSKNLRKLRGVSVTIGQLTPEHRISFIEYSANPSSRHHLPHDLSHKKPQIYASFFSLIEQRQTGRAR
jgi:hypothetical protein